MVRKEPSINIHRRQFDLSRQVLTSLKIATRHPMMSKTYNGQPVILGV